jgi:hypothetical protein
MITTITESQFRDAFNAGQYKNNFSYYGITALYEYLTEYEESTGEQIELDVCAICCDYAEHDTALECATQYGQFKDEEQTEEYALEWLQEQTQVIEFDNDNPFMDGRTSGIIIQDF